MKLKQTTIIIAGAVAFAVIAIALTVGVLNSKGASQDLQTALERESALAKSSAEVSTASDFLTSEVRAYAVSQDESHLDAYWNEIDTTKRRDRAVADLKKNGALPEELALIDKAKANSDALVNTETRAMWLVLAAGGTAPSEMPPAVGSYKPSAADVALSPEAKVETAQRILFDKKYYADKATISGPIDEFKSQIAARAESAVKSAESARDRSVAFLIGLAVLVALAMAAVLTVFHRSVGTVVSRYSAALAGRDESDHDFALEPAGTVELRGLADQFNAQFAANAQQMKANEALMADMRALVGEVNTASTTVSAGAQQMASTSGEAGKAVHEIASAVGDVAQGAERQVRQIDAVRTSAAQAASAARSSAEQADEAAEVAEVARTTAREGVDAAENASQAMHAVRDSSQSVNEAIRALAAKSEQIGGIVETITGIAGQTNLLALNAAIEAARAGEQGRGFAVVAEEVRKLAEESQNAAEEISGLVQQIQGETTHAVTVVEDGAERTEQGAATVEEAREAFSRIGEAVDDVNGRIAQIAAAVRQISEETEAMQTGIAEVAAVAEESSASAEQVSASTEQTAASTQEIAASAQELAATAATLERLVGQFEVEA